MSNPSHFTIVSSSPSSHQQHLYTNNLSKLTRALCDSVRKYLYSIKQRLYYVLNNNLRTRWLLLVQSRLCLPPYLVKNSLVNRLYTHMSVLLFLCLYNINILLPTYLSPLSAIFDLLHSINYNPF